MSPDKQRVAIAEACGWGRDGIWVESGKDAWRKCGEPDHWLHHELPDYLTDLNAMREAEEALTERQRAVYARVLCDLTDFPDTDDQEHIIIPKDDEYVGYIEAPADMTFRYINATAVQRAEAFLKTLGKWEEGA